jgi:hypothetical protein
MTTNGIDAWSYEVNILADGSKRARLAIIGVAVIAGAGLIWGRGFVGLADGQTTKNELTRQASIGRPRPPRATTST